MPGPPRLLPAATTSLIAAVLGHAPAPAAPLRVGDAVLEPVAVGALPGFARDDLGAALDTFRLSCATPPPRAPAVTGSAENLAAACAAAAPVTRADAAAFFARAFDAYRVVRPAQGQAPAKPAGFLTGYFEPELTGSLEPGPGFTAPVLARPDDLIAFEPGETRPGLDPVLRAARRRPDEAGEAFEAYPDRAAIEDGALGPKAKPLLYLRDAVDLFVLQVQGSGRVRLPDGRAVRVLYDGRNGRPYTSIGKLIVSEGHLPLEGLTLARWTGWLRANPAEARRLMRRNASYIFFRLAEIADPGLGPPGAAGVPLTPGRSLAVDAGLWSYGLPFWLDGALPGSAGAPGRLVVAQDTGSAIVGPARGDLYLGTGEAAGIAAGNLRDAVGFVVLLPKPATAPRGTSAAESAAEP